MKEELKNNYGVKRVMYVKYDNIFSYTEKNGTVENIILIENSELKELVLEGANLLVCYQNIAMFDESTDGAVVKFKYWSDFNNDINLNKEYIFFLELYNKKIICIGLENGARVKYKNEIENSYQWESFNQSKTTLLLKDFDCIKIQDEMERN